MNKKLEHIILDFDGVIGDTTDIIWTLFQEHGSEASYEDFLAHHDGNVYEEPRITFEDKNHQLFHSGYRNKITSKHLEKAIEPLRSLAAFYTLHTVSSNSEKSLNMILEQTGILKLFTRIMGMETHFSKVEKIMMLMEEHGVTPENTVFITDTLGDIKEGHKVGIKTIAVTFGFHNRERLEKGEPYLIVDTWEEVEQAIETI